MKYKEAKGSFRALKFTVYDHSSATYFTKNIGNIYFQNIGEVIGI